MELQSKEENNNQIRRKTKAGKVEQEERVKQNTWLLLQCSESFSVSFLFHTHHVLPKCFTTLEMHHHENVSASQHILHFFNLPFSWLSSHLHHRLQSIKIIWCAFLNHQSVSNKVITADSHPAVSCPSTAPPSTSLQTAAALLDRVHRWQNVFMWLNWRNCFFQGSGRPNYKIAFRLHSAIN